ncbi:LysR family transcriptional regulator [Salipiger sp. PrR002]|uniref:LysR family transcriptional regulator n=1 Tax=Salipiger sp. PrR002 TaxID=2706489 RepID=UPI001943D138|nr:LysR family transcriptional regulator [Salipiger sp. PrR002]
MPPLPNLRAMQAFEAVGRCGSVRRAAQELGVSSGAVSQQVHRLEEHLGLVLLERRGRQLELTSWGRVYHAELSKGFAQLNHAGAALARARNRHGFVISSLTTVTNKWLGPRLFEWTAENPGAPVRLMGTEIEPDLHHDNVDFRLFFEDRPPHEHYTELFTDRIVPACAPALLGGRHLQRPEEIFEFPLLEIVWTDSFAAHQVPDWEQWAAHCGLPPPPSSAKPALTFALSSSAIDAAVSGRGFVLGQLAMIGEELASGRLVVPFDLRMPLAVPYGLAWDRASLEKPMGRALRDWLLMQGRQQQQICAAAAG